MKLFAVALAVLLLVPAAAGANVTVSYSASTGLSVVGDGGSDTVFVDEQPNTSPVSFRLPFETNADGSAMQPTAGAGCAIRAGDTQAVTCDATGSLGVTASLGDGNDTFHLSGFSPDAPSHATIDGGGGDDTITDAPTGDLIHGGTGNDKLVGGAGNDLIFGDAGDDTFVTGAPSFANFRFNDTLVGGDGNDVFVDGTGSFTNDDIDGGAGTDTVDYSDRIADLKLTETFPSGSTADDGQANEHDNIKNVETMVGGAGNDTLSVTNATTGALPGVYALRGNGGNDTLSMSGQVAGNLNGGAGTDVLTGGPLGDVIVASDGIADTITCAGGTDSVLADLHDVIPRGCEDVTVKAVREGPAVVVSDRAVRVRRDGKGLIALRCPRALPPGCRGTLATRVAGSGGRFGVATRYRIGSGRSGVVATALPAHARTIQVRSVERGRLGRKTVLRTVKVAR